MNGSNSTPPVDRNLLSPQNLRNPFPLYKELREHDPVHWEEAIQAFFITRYEDVVEAYRDPRLSASRGLLFQHQLQGLSPDATREFMQTVQHQMFMKDGPEHVRLRRQTLTGFSNQRIDELRPILHRIMGELLDKVRPHGQADLLKDIAFPMPALALAELLGIPPEVHGRFRAWSEHLAAFSAPPLGSNPTELATHANQTMVEMKQYLMPLIEQRRQTPGKDSLSLMIQAQDQGRMTPEELMANACLFLFAGHTTTTDQLCNGIYDLLTHPDQLQMLRKVPGLLKSAVEEMLRFTSAVPAISRVAADDLTLHGKTIPKGSLVFLVNAAANRDPAVFTDPDRFDITRDSSRQKHVAFGFGAHHCMGAGLARRELEVGISMILERLPHLRLDESKPADLKWHSFGFRGFNSLPLRW